MNQKYTIQQLSEKMSEKTGVCQQAVLSSLRAIFSEISTELLSSGRALLPGIGEFSISENNVFEFEPSEELSSNINAPFEAFEPVELSDDFAIEEFDDPATQTVDNLTDLARPCSDIRQDHEALSHRDDVVAPVEKENTGETLDDPVPGVESKPETDAGESMPIVPPMVQMPSEQLPPPYDPIKAYAPPQCGYMVEEDEEIYSESGKSHTNGIVKFALGLICGLVIALGVGALALFFYINFIKN